MLEIVYTSLLIGATGTVGFVSLYAAAKLFKSEA